ncbi:MAG: T9SS C-terminal target domain-containing protein, partial [Calditrichaeota bacterium]
IEQTIWPIHNNVEIGIVKPAGALGLVYYTLDGSDPRLIGGAVSPNAIDADSGARFAVHSTTKLLARTFNNGQWSAIRELQFIGNENLGALQISEIHYHPLDEGALSGKLYEFIELHNSGDETLNLSLVSFVRGIDYNFPSGTTLEGNQFVVLASDSIHFQQRYGFAPFGDFSGQLDNSGENLALATAGNDTLIALRYNDKSPWPEEADGDGYSLVWTNKSGNADPNDTRNWTASHTIHGSPGQADQATAIADNIEIPRQFALHQNYPNPFNPETTIEFDLAKSSFVKLKVFDVLGRHVETLVEEHLSDGTHKIKWQARANVSGMYFVRIEAGEWVQTRKALLLR